MAILYSLNENNFFPSFGPLLIQLEACIITPAYYFDVRQEIDLYNYLKARQEMKYKQLSLLRSISKPIG
jgi:hypothetical protein